MVAESVQAEQVHEWRVERFEDLGFDARQVRILDVADADWHDALALLDQGCPHELVVRLLR